MEQKHGRYSQLPPMQPTISSLIFSQIGIYRLGSTVSLAL